MILFNTITFIIPNKNLLCNNPRLANVTKSQLKTFSNCSCVLMTYHVTHIGQVTLVLYRLTTSTDLFTCAISEVITMIER